MVADGTPLAVVVDLHTTFILTASTLVDRVSQSHKDILGWKEGGREGRGEEGFHVVFTGFLVWHERQTHPLNFSYRGVS